MLLFNYINPAYYAIAWTVIHAIWQISLVVLITAGIQALLKNTHSHVRYNIWVGALFLILIASVTTFIYYYSLDPALVIQQAQSAESRINEIGLTEKGYNAVSSSSPALSIASVASYVNEHILAIVMFWLVGMVLALIRLLGNIGYVEYLKNKFNFPVDPYWEELLQSMRDKMGIRKKVELLESALVMSPMVIGHLKPVIFFPLGAINRLAPEEVEAILAHELAHIMRHDYLINLMVSCVESLYYFHPAMWWLTAQIKAEREHCCDDLAIVATGRPLQYAQSLVAVQEMAMYAPRLAMQFAGREKKSRFFLRVNRLIKPVSNGSNNREKSMAVVIMALLVFVVAMASKPIDTAAHCLPTVNPGNERYLKFETNGNLDSLALEFAINDGVYHYNDHYYHAEMEVVNRRVITLVLNGLKISGNDIKRFGNLIKDILLADQQTRENSKSDSPDEPAFYDAFAKDLIKDGLLTNVKLNTVSFNREGLFVNQQKQAEEIRQKYLTLYMRLKSAGMPEIPELTLDIYPDEKGTLIQTNLVGEKDNGKEDKFTDQKTQDKRRTDPLKNHGESSVDRAFNAWLEVALMEDGYIEDPEEYSYVWTESNFVVDGVEVEKGDVSKYHKKYKEITGKKMDKTFLKTRNVTRD